MKYVLIIIIALTILCAVSCEETQRMQGLGGEDNVEVSTDTPNIPPPIGIGTGPIRVPFRGG